MLRRGNPLVLLRRATGRALVGTVVGSIPGFLLPFAIAVHFHVGRLTDAYAFALSVAVFASGVFNLVLQSNALPIFQRMKHFGRTAFVHRLRKITLGSTGVVTLLYAVIALASLIYVHHLSHWTARQHELVWMATAIFAIFVVASGINGILSAGLNALDRFLLPAAAQALKSLAPLAAIALVRRDVGGLLLIASLVAAGELLQTAFLYIQLTVALRSVPARRPPDGSSTELPLWRVAAPHGFSMFIAAASPLVDRGVAASLTAGSVTLIDLGEKVFLVPLTVISSSFVLVAGAHWANITVNDPELGEHFWRTITRGLLVCLVLVIGTCVGLAGFAALAGSTFAGAPTSKIIAIIAFLLAGLPAAFVIAAGARLLASTRSTYLLPWFAICSLGLNTLFDVLGARWFGVEGIALSSTIYRCVTASLLLVVIHRLLKTNFRGVFALSPSALPPV
jgi:peptidoglycan biosynthesis protein MviN/MurJ (putative lipid II flippase)